MIAERSKAGRDAARRRGKHLGRPLKLTPEQVAHAQRSIKAKEASVSGMAKLLSVGRVTLHRALKRAEAR